MTRLAAVLIVSAVAFASGPEPDGLVLAPGFHASDVADGARPSGA